MADNEQDVIKLPIEWNFPSDLRTVYANHLIVQHTEHEFVISFFEAHAPIVFGSAEQKKAQLEALESVPANCVARIVVARSRMPVFMKVLQDNLSQLPGMGDVE